ncbi:MAG: hypothetical protein ABR567_03235 [Myxococcales bacterium]|nr:hypothetical protein [Myxococcales bacterium]
MRPLLLIVLAAACVQSPEPTAPRAEPLTVEQVRAPRDNRTSVISGLVTKREGGAVMLDSGGPNQIPLVLAESTKVTLDDQPASGADIREGDLVRAAYRLDDGTGEPVALQVVANSRPPATAKVQAPPAQSKPQK